MGVQFPTRPTTTDKDFAPPFGEPLRAQTCECGPLQRVDEDGLCRHCGYWPRETVDETWRQQARRTGYHGPLSVLEAERRRRLELAA
jgi:hypothetical protein